MFCFPPLPRFCGSINEKDGNASSPLPQDRKAAAERIRKARARSLAAHWYFMPVQTCRRPDAMQRTGQLISASHSACCCAQDLARSQASTARRAPAGTYLRACGGHSSPFSVSGRRSA